MELKAGARLRSTVDEVEVIVVKAPGVAVDLRAGGRPMVPIDGNRSAGAEAGADPTFQEGTVLGKRYVDASGELEVLCTKAGPSSLSMSDEPLATKQAKPLPSSD